MRLTVSRDKIDYPYKTSTQPSDLTTVKVLVNSTISTPKARFMTLDIKIFFLNTVMKRDEWMRISIKQIPQEVIDEYNLDIIVHNG